MAINVNPFTRAFMDCAANRNTLLSKGFKQAQASDKIKYVRGDAELVFNPESCTWVCDVWQLKDGSRSPYKHFEGERLTSLLREFI